MAADTPRMTVDLNRLNYTIQPVGQEYQQRIAARAGTIFRTLIGLLPSSWVSAVQGPNYTVELKAVAVELSKIELALEDLNNDLNFDLTRSDFLYSIIGYLVFLGGKIPQGIANDDAELRKILLALISIYFQGSVPAALRDVVDLVTTQAFELKENFLLVRQGASGLDISDQWGFQIMLEGNQFPPDLFNFQSALRAILDMVRPAHTLYTLRYVFGDTYNPNDPTGRVLDSVKWRMASYYYEDFRTYWGGLAGQDRLGRTLNQAVTGEDHSGDF
jgi:hypothetical protein